MRRHHHRRQRARGARPSRTTRSSSTRRTSSIPLESYVERLDKVVFQESLGTVREKAERLETLACALAADAQLDAGRRSRREARRAPVQGRPGDECRGRVHQRAGRHGQLLRRRLRARTPQVAQAIGQHYQPRFAGDALPDTIGGHAWWPWPTSSTPSAACSRSARRPTGSVRPVRAAPQRHRHREHAARRACLSRLPPPSIESPRHASPPRASPSTAAAVRAEVVRLLRHPYARSCCATPASTPTPWTPCWPRAWRSRPVISQRAHALEDARANVLAEAFDDLATAYARANNLRDAAAGRTTWTSRCSPSRACARGRRGNRRAVPGGSRACVPMTSQPRCRQLAALRAPIDALLRRRHGHGRGPRLCATTACACSTASSRCSPTSADFGKMAKSK